MRHKAKAIVLISQSNNHQMTRFHAGRKAGLKAPHNVLTVLSNAQRGEEKCR